MQHTWMKFLKNIAFIFFVKSKGGNMVMGLMNCALSSHLFDNALGIFEIMGTCLNSLTYNACNIYILFTYSTYIFSSSFKNFKLT